MVPCNPELKEELLLLISKRKVGSHEPIFMNEQRQPTDHNNFIKRKYDQDLEDWTKKTSNKTIRFHDLRHTPTTLLISGGVDLKTVKEICGHAKIETTMLYAHLVGRSIEKVARSFSKSFKREEEFTEVP
ncbi:MAG: tyrosine-type recombinase/integrase [Bdellovibrionaceae bacterium]|nr:tyrosine-type recombinase/integrase [Pseudobdellovibrionaceae bacterium]